MHPDNLDLSHAVVLLSNHECFAKCHTHCYGRPVVYVGVCAHFMIPYHAYAGLKHSDGHQEVDHDCVCINGYLQPQPFLERIYLLTESDDVFVDRLLVCFPKTHILMEEV